MYNSIGQLLYHEENINEQNKKINIEKYETQVLFIHISNGDQNKVFKLMKQ